MPLKLVAPGKCGCNFEIINFKLNIQNNNIGEFHISYQWEVNIGFSNGWLLSGNKPLPELLTS